MNETDYTKKFMRAWLAHNPSLWWHKIADVLYGGSMTNPRAVDVIVSVDGRFVGMEWKLRRSDGKFPVKNVRLNQILTLLKIYNSDGVGLLVIGRHIKRGDREVYIIPIMKWINKISSLKVDGRAPISVDLSKEFENYLFHPWDFGWLEYCIKENYLNEMRAPTPELMRKLHGTV